MAVRVPIFMGQHVLSTQIASQIVAEGGLIIDLRWFEEYLDRHLRGSVPILYEAGPGFASRARDLLPIDTKVILLNEGTLPLDVAAAMLRGKGFDVVGSVAGLDDWDQDLLASTPQVDVDAATHLDLLDVRDPGTEAPEGVSVIPAESIWSRADEIDRNADIGVLSGWGVRASTAVGILESLGLQRLSFVRTRPVGSRPPTAGPEEQIFRVGGPGARAR